jgi:hypothetical protein
MSRALSAAAVALLCLPTLAPAAKVKVWQQGAAAHYDKARLKGAVVTGDGALRLARRLDPLVGLDATHVWDVVEDGTGTLYVATGDAGRLYRVTPDGKVAVAYQGAESEVLCLALAPDGSVYAGTGPGGLIVRLTPDQRAGVFCHTPEPYVWSLAFDAATGGLYAGTGPHGRIYRVTAQGKATLFSATRQEHVLCLAAGPDGMLYAGTARAGLVYRFDPTGKGFVLYQAPQAEVHSLLVTAEAVYGGTSSPRRRSGLGTAGVAERSSPSDFTAQLGPGAKTAGTASRAERLASSTTPASSGSSAREEHGGASPGLPPPTAGENSVYRISPDGGVREVFREKALVLCLLRQHGRLLIGTGMEGQLFELDEHARERSELARLDHGQIHTLCRRRDGSVVIGTGDPGRLYVLQGRYAAQGTVTSEVLDTRMISKWGSLRWKAETPPGTRITVAVRSGNLAEPDETWSDWSPEQTDAERATAVAPPARFLQYRLTLASDDPAVTPAVRGLSVRYLNLNQAPEVTAIEVPDLDTANLENKKLKLKWTATDANDDDLTYSLYVRKEGWKNWVLVEDALDKREYEWDTTTTPSGVYRLKVVASDRKDNPAEEALTGARVSEPFVVAHEAPAVALKVAGMEGGRAVLEATATDPLVRLTAAAFAVNGKPWVNVFPTDGLFDSKVESFRFATDTLKPGTYVVVLRVRDAAGNTGSADAVFTVRARTTQPGD